MALTTVPPYGDLSVAAVLKTRSGEFVQRVWLLKAVRLDLMPEVVGWGDRLFVRRGDPPDFDSLEYFEAMPFVVRHEVDQWNNCSVT